MQYIKITLFNWPYRLNTCERILILKNLNKNISGKYSQKLVDHAKQSFTGTDALKTTSKTVIQKK